MSGTLTEDAFNDYLNEFVKISDLLIDGWKLNRDIRSNAIYLIKKDNHYNHSNVKKLSFTKSDTIKYDYNVKTEIKFNNIDDNNEDENSEFIGNDNDDNDNDEQLKLNQNFSLIITEYTILYNSSYNCPVLYFNFYYTNGKPLQMIEIWQMIPSIYNHNFDEKLFLQMITQSEHPIFGRPYFTIHPCKTSEFMKKALFNTNKSTPVKINYILTWLTTIAPLIGLYVPIDYLNHL